MSAPASLVPEQINVALGKGWTVLTANQRTARTLRHDYDRDSRASGLDTWQPPDILPVDAWMAALWHRLLLEGHVSAVLLNQHQEHVVWRSVIEADQLNRRGRGSLQSVDALAEVAADAWSLLHAYGGQPRLRAAVETFDAKTFERWANAFQQTCRSRDFLPQAQLADALRQAVTTGKVRLQIGLLLVGFDTKTPSQESLLSAIQRTGVKVGALELNSALPCTVVGAPDQYSELTTAAHWLRSHLTEHPKSRVAVIAPSLESERAQIDRVFRNVLAPELEDIGAAARPGPFEFSLGVPLASTAMVATAFDILRWATGPLGLDRVSALLLSPYFASSGESARDEVLARAEFDAFRFRNQRVLRPEASIDLVVRLVLRAHTPILAQSLWYLRANIQKKELTAKELPHSGWVATIQNLLDAAGWANSRSLDSNEFQVLGKWEKTLDQLAALDFDNRLVTFAEAVDALERIAKASLFAPESRQAPIQIMGPLESAGSVFDAIWFLRADDASWPAKPVPNPLLPWHLQRELGIPGTDPGRDSELASHITERIAASAPIVFFSYAHESARGQQRPSSALKGLAVKNFSSSEILVPPTRMSPISLEALVDDGPIPCPPDGVLQGGASILKAQAECGFRAFAEKRLFSHALEDSSLGLDPRERGAIVHTVLERFWEKVLTQAALKQMQRSERDEVLQACIAGALAGPTSKIASPWDRAYVDAEHHRLLRLIHAWLEYECTRAPFTVKTRESLLNDVTIGPLRLSVRVDRIDVDQGMGVADRSGGEIIIDYKTGVATPSKWVGDRPDEPQLPLYAVVSEATDLAAVAFATLRTGDTMGMIGFEATKGILPKSARMPADSLAAQVQDWRVVLTQLAENFHAGDASVSPKSFPHTCRYCKQRLLCRLDPSTLEGDDVDDFEDGNNEFAEASLG